jgi:hypothetical protein
VETGRAQAGRELILRLAEELAIPLRERNALLIAAGFAPTFQQRPFSDPSFDGVRAIVELALETHKPFHARRRDTRGDCRTLATTRPAGLYLHVIDSAAARFPN